MDSSVALWLLSAIVLFWLTGLYNRLMRLRARTIEVYAELEVQVLLCAEMLTIHVAELPPVATLDSLNDKGVAEAWRAMQQSRYAVDIAWGGSRKKSFDVEDQRKRAETWAALQAAWDGLLALPLDTTAGSLLEDLRRDWESSRQKVKSVQEALNSIVESYNNALLEYPARWVTWMMGFEPCEKI